MPLALLNQVDAARTDWLVPGMIREKVQWYLKALPKAMRNREMPPVLPGELVAVSTAGAYGFVLSSNYNSRPRVPEVLVEGDSWRVIRRRETLEDLVRGE